MKTLLIPALLAIVFLIPVMNNLSSHTNRAGMSNGTSPDPNNMQDSSSNLPCGRSPDSVVYEELRYKWIKVTCDAAFSPRDGAGALVFKDSMWLIGGWNRWDTANFPLKCNNEVWKSADGLHWEKVKPNTFIDKSFDPKADWEGRHSAGYAVYKGKMWIIGGDANQRHYQNDVWNSSDGKRWELVTDSIPWGPRVLHITAVYDNKIWLMGGQTMSQFAGGKDRFYSDVWNTTDGKNWQKLDPNDCRWLPRGMIGGQALFKNRLWILGGGTYETRNVVVRKLYNDIWSTTDGINWKCHTQEADWQIRCYHDVAVWDDKMWVLEGTSCRQIKGVNNRDDVWYSDDGENWTELPKTPWRARHASSVYVYNDCLWVVAGNNMESDVWKLCRY
jgi:hypothetical protein